MLFRGLYNGVDIFNKPDNAAEWSLYLLEILSCLLTVWTAGSFDCKLDIMNYVA